MNNNQTNELFLETLLAIPKLAIQEMENVSMKYRLVLQYSEQD
jgi:hypothetical protein